MKLWHPLVAGQNPLGWFGLDSGILLHFDSRVFLCLQLWMESEESAVRNCPLCQLTFPTGYPDDALIKHIDSHLENSKIWLSFIKSILTWDGHQAHLDCFIFRFCSAIVWWACMLSFYGPCPVLLVHALGITSLAQGTLPSALLSRLWNLTSDLPVTEQVQVFITSFPGCKYLFLHQRHACITSNISQSSISTNLDKTVFLLFSQANSSFVLRDIEKTIVLYLSNAEVGAAATLLVVLRMLVWEQLWRQTTRWKRPTHTVFSSCARPPRCHSSQGSYGLWSIKIR